MSKATRKTPTTTKFGENINYVLAAFAVAFVAWFFAKQGQTQESSLVVRLKPENLDARIEARLTPETMRVYLRYPTPLQTAINSDNFHFAVDMTGADEGLGIEWQRKTMALTSKQWVVSMPYLRRVELLQVGTQGNTVEIETRWKAVAAHVQPDLAGQNQLRDRGLQLAEPVKVTPAEAWVVGDEAALAAAPRDPQTGKIELTTERINAAEFAEPTVRSVSIVVPQGLQLVKPQTAVAEVSLDIQEPITMATLSGIAVAYRPLSPDTVEAAVSPTSASVVVKGPPSLLRQLGSESIDLVPVRPAAELPGESHEVAVEAQFSRLVRDDVAAKVKITEVRPRSVTVTYRPRAASAATTSSIATDR